MHLNDNANLVVTLLNLDFIDAGVVGTCGKLCSLLEQKTGSQALGVVCDLLCDIVGIEEFIKIVQKWVFLNFLLIIVQ